MQPILMPACRVMQGIQCAYSATQCYTVETEPYIDVGLFQGLQTVQYSAYNTHRNTMNTNTVMQPSLMPAPKKQVHSASTSGRMEKLLVFCRGGKQRCA
eukprot:1160099-Pelagomonas_calceolata.AAC.1